MFSFQVKQKHDLKVSNLNYVSPPKMLQAYFNNVLIRNHIMLVRHLMLEVNKGWHFRDALIILLLNTTLARLQTFMTLDLSNFFFFFKRACYAFSATAITPFKCTYNAFRAANTFIINSRSRQLVEFDFIYYYHYYFSVSNWGTRAKYSKRCGWNGGRLIAK